MDELTPKDDAAELLANVHGKHFRFVMAALGVIPWVGAFIAASAAIWGEHEQGAINLTLQRWLQEHQEKLEKLQASLVEVTQRVDRLGEPAKERLNEEQFLPLVRRAYAGWDRAQTADKRRLFERLLCNAAGSPDTDEDMVRLFVDWIDRYDDTHFRIIAAIYQNHGIGRLGIWMALSGGKHPPREDSREADLFRMLIHDLSTGRVIRQSRTTTADGHFVKKAAGGRAPSRSSSPYMKSAFDNSDPYELSELGREFVRYVLNEAVPRIGG